MDTRDIEKVVKILQKSDITEFELESEGVRIKLTRSQESQGNFYVPQSAPAIPIPSTPAQNPLDSVPTEVAKDGTDNYPSHYVKVESPIVGTFYRKPSPDSQAFVSEGNSVVKGETLCIVEAMKLMNEIPSPCDGKIVKILIKDSQVVEYGEPMFVIDPA